MTSETAALAPIYEETAHVTIDTDGLTPDEIIISALKFSGRIVFDVFDIQQVTSIFNP